MKSDGILDVVLKKPGSVIMMKLLGCKLSVEGSCRLKSILQVIDPSTEEVTMFWNFIVDEVK